MNLISNSSNFPAATSTDALEIWVSGYVHSCGGAGPELAHQIDLWRSYGVEVHLCVFASDDEVLRPDNARRQWCEARGVHTHLYEPGIFRDKVLVSFCQNDFMERLPEICATGRPRTVVWFNCMTWNHGDEPGYLRDGLIDVFGFQSRYQRDALMPVLQETAQDCGRLVRELEGYVPFYSLQADNLHAPRFELRAPGEKFVIGRLSRDDPNKWPANFWELCSRIATPRPKKIFAVGYGPHAHEKCGDPQQQPFACKLDRIWWGYCADSRQLMTEFWPRVHLLFHKWDSFRENYPRALLEAMAAGVPIICDRAGGNPELIIDGVTGFLVESDDEAVYRASQIAWDNSLRLRLIKNAHQWLHENVANAAKCWEPWRVLLEDQTDEAPDNSTLPALRLVEPHLSAIATAQPAFSPTHIPAMNAKEIS